MTTSTDMDGLAAARDLHDCVLQDLIVITMQLRRASAADDPQISLDAIQNALAAANHGMTQTRDIIRALRENTANKSAQCSETVSMQKHIEDVFAELDSISDLHIKVVCDQDFDLCRQIAIELGKIVREAAVNTIRHAEATRLTCRLRLYGNRAICIKISDDGKGYPIATQAYGLGILGMRERAHLIGATLKIASSVDEGSAISILIPLTGATRRFGKHQVTSSAASSQDEGQRRVSRVSSPNPQPELEAG